MFETQTVFVPHDTFLNREKGSQEGSEGKARLKEPAQTNATYNTDCCINPVFIS
jgi:hypothetical protein